MREQKTVELEGHSFLITSFGARKGIKLGKRVAKVLLPAVGKLYSGEESEGASLGDMFEVIAENLDELDDQTIEELLSETTVNKYQIDFDNFFAGQYALLFKVLWEVIEFNFSSIFTELTDATNG